MDIEEKITKNCKILKLDEKKVRDKIVELMTSKNITKDGAFKIYFTAQAEKQKKRKEELKKTETKPKPQEKKKYANQKDKKKREGMIYDIGYYGSSTAVIIQLTKENMCFFRFATGIKRDGTGDKKWETVKMNSTDIGNILYCIDNKVDSPLFHQANGKKKVIGCKSDDKGLILGLSIKDEFSCRKMFNMSEMQSLKSLLNLILPYLFEEESKLKASFLDREKAEN